MAASGDDPMSQYQLLSGKTILVIGASYMTTDRRFIWKTFQDLKVKVRFCNSCETHVHARVGEWISLHIVLMVCFFFFFFFINLLT